MAGKPEPRPAPSYGAVEIGFFTLLVLGIAKIISNWISKNHDLLINYYNTFAHNLINIFARYVIFALLLSIVLLILVIIYIIKENKIRQKIMSRVLPPEGGVKKEHKEIGIENPKWKLVEEHINSDDANKWKLAIIEADIILSELLDSLGLPGEGIGEKLKAVESSDFDHIEEAWEAHKIRNAIAHQGSDFLLTQKEAKRVIKLFRSVFEEFEII